MTEYRGYHIEQAHVPGNRKAFMVSCSWDALVGVPEFRTEKQAKKAIDLLERGEFIFQFATMKAAKEWRDEFHCKWEVRYNEKTGKAEVIPDEWHRRLYQEIEWAEA